MAIPPRFDPSPLTDSERQGWLAWSLPFFTDPTHPQNPHLSITLPLEVSAALRRHRAGEPGATFFAWVAWSLLQVMEAHPAFLLRRVREEWWLIRNPPLVVPVAVGGQQRFVELVLEDVIAEPWPQFAARYSRRLQALRAGEVRRADWDAYNLGVVVGNLPNLPFTGFSLHSHGGDAAGRCVFYVGQRSERDGVTTMPPPIPTFSTSCWPTGATAISTTCPHDWDLRVAVHALHHLGKKGLIKIAAED